MSFLDLVRKDLEEDDTLPPSLKTMILLRAAELTVTPDNDETERNDDGNSPG